MTTLDELADEAQVQAAAVLKSLKTYRRLSDDEVALRAGMTRSMANAYLNGVNKLTVGLVARFAAALGVEPSVFFMTPDEAVVWTIEHSPNSFFFDVPPRPTVIAKARTAGPKSKPRRVTSRYPLPAGRLILGVAA
ncbi:MAG TPA: helix-turn-helix transcriptional regulator [Acidimicrobiales bacterium]|nr:helix-turn-helix transcriptional regulator [Acidimicrobiales bacterium]